VEKYKKIDEKISEGYKLLERGQTIEACDVWLDAWEDIKTVMAADKVKALPTLQEKYKWTEFVMNYMQDLDEQLYNAAIEKPNISLNESDIVRNSLSYAAIRMN
jgi:septation ring formation regulator EzrA